MTRSRESRRDPDSLAATLSRLGLSLLTAEQRARVLEPLRQFGNGMRRESVAFDPATRRLLYVELARSRAKAPDLARTMSALQRLATSPAFVPWILLARENRAGILYLHSHASQVPELRRWLERHPLYGQLPAPFTGTVAAIRVPAIVYAAPP